MGNLTFFNLNSNSSCRDLFRRILWPSFSADNVLVFPRNVSFSADDPDRTDQIWASPEDVLGLCKSLHIAAKSVHLCNSAAVHVLLGVPHTMSLVVGLFSWILI